jgi:predicted 2-oxoglutarate/Fe(II)-dependent dioxygenase YbiX
MILPNLEKPKIEWDIPNKILITHNVLSDSECEDIISFGERNVRPGVNKYAHVFSNKFDSCLLPLNHNAHNMLQTAWQNIQIYFDFALDFIEPYELKKYYPECHFGKHVDNYYGLTQSLDRKITLSVQLTDPTEYQGGTFNVLNRKYKLPKGSIIAFPSFFTHEVEPIIIGIRWSLIGWAWGPYWK